MPLIGSTQETNPNTTSSDRPKALLDEQNRQLVERVQLIQSKLDWLKAKLELKKASFTTQQVGGNGAATEEESFGLGDGFNPDPQALLDRMLASAAGLKKSSSYIDYVNGCFNYYDNDGEYKRKPNPSNSEEPLEPSIDVISAVVQSNGSMTVKGRVNNAPAEFDYQTLRPDFLGDGALTGPSTVQAQGSGLFTLFVVATPTDAYAPKADAGKPVELRITTAGDFQTQAGNVFLRSKACQPRTAWPPNPGISVSTGCHLFELQRIFGGDINSGTDALNLVAKEIYKNNQILFPVSQSGKNEKFLRNEKFYKKNLIYDKNLGIESKDKGARDKTIISENSAAKIYISNLPFKTPSSLVKTLIHEYVNRRFFMNGDIFKLQRGELELSNYKTTHRLNNENKLSIKINEKNIVLSSSELHDDKEKIEYFTKRIYDCQNLTEKQQEELNLLSECKYIEAKYQKTSNYFNQLSEYD